MKKTILKLFCGLSLAASVISCADFLAEKPKTFLTPDNYFNTEKQMQAAVDGLYAHLGGIFSGEIEVQSSRYNFLEYLSGYAVRPRSATTTSFQYAKALSVTDDIAALEGIWQYHYTAIENCNSVIAGLESAKEGMTSEAKKKQLLGEAYALRAYYYFNLVRLWGPIPYKTTPTTELNNVQLPLTLEEDVYAGIEKDLEKADEYMADVAWMPGTGHIGKAAVKSLMAKVYITMAGYPLQKGKDYYDKAYNAAKSIYDNNGASLFSSYSDLRNESLENTGEFIFCIQREQDKAGSPMHSAIIPYPRSVPEVTASPDAGGAFAAPYSFYNSYAENDIRKNDRQFFYWTEDAMDGSGTVELDVTNHMYVYKFWNDNAASTGKNGMDFPLIRYADVLLVLAEAKAMSDGGSTSDATAIDAYHKVRSRAVPGEGKPSSLSFDTVYKERFWELCFENQTIFDMLRTRKAFDTDNGKIVDLIGFHCPSHDEGVKWEEADLLMPYPLRDKRLNPNLVR